MKLTLNLQDCNANFDNIEVDYNSIIKARLQIIHHFFEVIYNLKDELINNKYLVEDNKYS